MSALFFITLLTIAATVTASVLAVTKKGISKTLYDIYSYFDAE